MKRQAYAEITLSDPTKPLTACLVQAKPVGRDDTSSYGEWSLAVQPVTMPAAGTAAGAHATAFIAFLSDDAPHEALQPGGALELFYGTTRVGTANLQSDACGAAGGKDI